MEQRQRRNPQLPQRRPRNRPGLPKAPSSYDVDSPAVAMRLSFARTCIVSGRDVPAFNARTRPRSFPEKLQTGLHTWIMEEAADGDMTPHLFPSILCDQFRDDGFQRDSVERIVWLRDAHVWPKHDTSRMGRRSHPSFPISSLSARPDSCRLCRPTHHELRLRSILRVRPT